MSAPIIAFFNNKGGVGTTTLVYHLAWMLSDLGIRVLAADLDPQADLTTLCLGQDRIEDLWDSSLVPIISEWLRPGRLEPPWDLRPWHLDDNLHLILGDLRLAGWERDGIEANSFARILPEAAQACRADVLLLDLGPNLGVINRAALFAADYLVVPVNADRFSRQGMINIGETLPGWRSGWERAADLRPLGYVVQQGAMRINRPVRLFEQWIALIPSTFHNEIIGGRMPDPATSIIDDKWCLAIIKHYHSLMPLAQQAQKPMFRLTPADGGSDSQIQAAQSVGKEYKRLAERIAKAAGLELPYLSGSVA